MTMDPFKTEHQQLRELIIENRQILAENNVLLKKMYRTAWWSFVFRTIFSLVFIGAPFIIYFFIIEPYFNSLGSSFDVFEAGMQEIPGWKQFFEAMGGEVSESQ